MRIAILSNNSNCYSTTRLKQAARARGHTVRVLSSSKFSLDIRSSNPDLLYHGKPLQFFDAIIPRIGVSQNFMGTAVLRQFEQMGAYCLNPSFAVSVARDKLRSLQILSRHNVKIPTSSFVFSKSDILPALERVGGAPVVIKVLEGMQGAGVMLADTTGVAQAIIEALQVTKHNVIIQRFIAESKGRDIRAFVVGDKVIAAMRRVAQEGEFRSNVHLGASTEQVVLDADYERAALHAARILGLRVAGVDLIESTEGPQILEVNASPGLEGIEHCTQVDIADQIMQYLEEQVQFPDVDLRERLSLSKGYSIAEIPVGPTSNLAGSTIEANKFAESEIQVLSITRGSVTLPLPPLTEVLHSGDLLLLFGKQATLKALMPAKLPKGKKRRIQKLKPEQVREALAASSFEEENGFSSLDQEK